MENWDDDDFEPPPPIPSVNKWADEVALLAHTQEDVAKKDTASDPTAKKKHEFDKLPKELDKRKAPSELDPELEKAMRDHAINAAKFEDARDLFAGVRNENLIDTEHPKDLDDFLALAELLGSKAIIFEKSIHYKSFLRSLFLKLTASLSIDERKDMAGLSSDKPATSLAADKPSAVTKPVATANRAKKRVPPATKKATSARSAEIDDEDLEGDLVYDKYDSYNFM